MLTTDRKVKWIPPCRLFWIQTTATNKNRKIRNATCRPFMPLTIQCEEHLHFNRNYTSWEHKADDVWPRYPTTQRKNPTVRLMAVKLPFKCNSGRATHRQSPVKRTRFYHLENTQVLLDSNGLDFFLPRIGTGNHKKWISFWRKEIAEFQLLSSGNKKVMTPLFLQRKSCVFLLTKWTLHGIKGFVIPTNHFLK